jgi:putative oxidoreductase
LSLSVSHSKLNNSLNLAARVLLASLFLSAGISKITNFQVINDLVSSIGIPFAAAWTALVLILEIVGSIAIILGYKSRVAAALLGIFTIITAFLFHNYWAVPADQQYVQQLLFLKNISIAGGLFLLTSFNSGKWSLDEKLKNKATHQNLNQVPVAG